MEDKEGEGKTWVVLVPLPFQGHVNPMLELGAALRSKGLSILVLQTNFNPPDTPNYPDFLFHQVPVARPTSASPSALILDLNAECEAPFREFLAEMAMGQGKSGDRIGCIVHDNLLYFCEDVAAGLNLPSATLRTNSATALLACLEMQKLLAQGLVPMEETMQDKPLDDLYPLRFKDLALPKHGNLDETRRLVDLASKTPTSPAIWNTFDDIEHQSLQKLQRLFQVPFFAIGPLHKIAPSTNTGSLYKEDWSCISWLDKQATRSVLYVSFGSSTLMDEKGFTEMAWGLINSDQPFLWVVRPGSVCQSEWIDMLSNNLKENTEERGYVVKWAPQKEVLAHRAVGGFLSHCGWNSTIESISAGVPVICFPYLGDQTMNARCLSHLWRVGLELEPEIERGKVEVAVRRLLVDEEGKGIRQRATDLKEKADVSLRKDGSSFNSLGALVKFIRYGTT